MERRRLRRPAPDTELWGSMRTETTCLDCGTPIPVPPPRHRPRLRCEPCRHAHVLATRRAYYHGHKDRISEQSKAHYQANREHYLARNRDWYEANRETQLEYSRERYRQNPDRYHEFKLLRRAREKGNGRYEAINRKRLFERDNWTCGICGGPIDPEAKRPDRWSAEVDHIIPLARGGTHTWDNVQAAHGVCNLRKSDRTPDEIDRADFVVRRAAGIASSRH